MSRNWKEYNNKLVKRGKFCLLTDFIEYWDEELEEMNKNKRSSPFEFLKSFIDFAAFLKIVFNLPYRQLQGVVKKMACLFNLYELITSIPEILLLLTQLYVE